MTTYSYGNHLQLCSIVYEMAALIEEMVIHCPDFIEVNWQDASIIKGIYKPSKISLLHQYIFSTICVHFRRDYRKNASSYEEEEINSLEAVFRVYSIIVPSFAHYFQQAGYDDDEFADGFYSWFCVNEEHFQELWGKITDEVFHLLFANRLFLLEFNLKLANYLKSGAIATPSNYLTNKGTVKRLTSIPKWLKNAIYYRDHGRCVLCQRDLSGLLSTDRRLHFDHMVPLNIGGTNDPCNFQLLCDECNLRKSGNIATTALRYATWWDYDDY